MPDFLGKGKQTVALLVLCSTSKLLMSFRYSETTHKSNKRGALKIRLSLDRRNSLLPPAEIDGEAVFTLSGRKPVAFSGNQTDLLKQELLSGVKAVR